ncbi:MAG: YeeE/YedE thiosulfate transporter family protein [Smithella sp.]
MLDLKHFFFAFLFKKSIISSEKREKPSRYINCTAALRAPVRRVAHPHSPFETNTRKEELAMKLKTEDGGWSPYLAGALVGVLAIVSVYATTQWMGKPNYLGASTTFVRAAGLLERTVFPERVAANEYFTKEKVRLDWQFMLVIGIFFGALISSKTDRSFKLESVPPTWKERFGPSIGKRAAGAFLGGIVAMMGARMADGCPSGHGLSGMMQLSVSAFIALAMFFGTGIVVAGLLYRRRSS